MKLWEAVQNVAVVHVSHLVHYTWCGARGVTTTDQIRVPWTHASCRGCLEAVADRSVAEIHRQLAVDRLEGL